MALKFLYRKASSAILGTIYRPVAKVLFWSKKGNYWSEIWMIVDSGADYTLLPRYLAKDLKVDLEKECQIFSTQGIGGTEKVYFLPKITIKLGDWERIIPVGFLDRDGIPPLMGRHLFLETFEVFLSSNHSITFASP